VNETKLYEKTTNNHLIHIIKKGLQCEGMLSLLRLALISFVHVYWQHILELLQGNDSSPLNAIELVHKVWLDMIKLNALTH